MRQLQDDTHLSLEGAVRVYRRERSLWASRSFANNHQAHEHAFARMCARAQIREKDKSLTPLDSVALRHFVSLVVSLKNKGLSANSAKPLI